MYGIEDLRTLRDVTRNTMDDNEFKQIAKDNFYSDEDINSVLNGGNTTLPQTPITDPVAIQPNPVNIQETQRAINQDINETNVNTQSPQPVTTEAQQVNETRQDTSSDDEERPPIEDMIIWARRRKRDLRKRKDKLKELGYSDADIKKVDNQFEIMDDKVYNAFVEDLADGASMSQIALDLAKHYANGSTDDAVIEDAAAEASRMVNNFRLTRMLKNKGKGLSKDGVFSGSFSRKSLKERFPELTDEDIAKIRSTDLTPSFIDSLTNWDGLKLGMEQDWLGVKKALSHTGLVDFTDEDTQRLQELTKEEKRREIRENAWFGIDSSDFSPLMIASLISLSNPIAAPIVGGLSGYTYTLGQGESEKAAVLSGTLGAAFPFAVNIVKSLGKTIASKFRISNEQASADIKQELGEASPDLLKDIIDFSDKIGYKINIGSIVPKESQTYNIARAAIAYSKVFRQMGDTLNSNYSALNRATKQTIEELNNNPVAAKLINSYDDILKVESQAIDDPVSTLLKTNLTEAQTKLSAEIKNTYDDFSKLAREIPLTPNSSEIIENILSYRDTIHKTLEGTPAEKFKEALDKLIVNNFSKKSADFTLNDLEDLSKSVDKIAKGNKDSEILGIKSAFREHLTELKINRLEQIKQAFVNKAEKSPIDEAVIEKVDNALQTQYKAKELYKSKRALYIDTNSKKYIGNFVDTKGAEVLSNLLKNSTTEQLASLKSAFSYVGKEKEFQQIGKRIVLDSLAGAFETQTSKFNTRLVGSELQKIFDQELKLELFGFDKEATESLRYIYNLSKIQDNFAKLYSRELTTSNQTISLLQRMLNHIPDMVRGLLLGKSLPSNDKIKTLVNQIQKDKTSIDKKINSMMWTGLKKTPYQALQSEMITTANPFSMYRDSNKYE